MKFSKNSSSSEGILKCVLALLFLFVGLAGYSQQRMDEMWGDSGVNGKELSTSSAKMFDDGNYAMFVHWGMFSELANRYEGKTYYGIGEWIMNKDMANIDVGDYKPLAKKFNPVDFDARAIAKLAKDAGMKYIIITSKHHDGFAMFDTKVDDFDIVDATTFGRDPMKELSEACREFGLGFGFYYSHNQDWTYPGGRHGPKFDENGNPVDFEYYFKNKCLPQVKEITTNYGKIDIVWFDTPGPMKKEYIEQLVDVVRKNQPEALISGRVGHKLGDYMTLGDMEVPHQNISGRWETPDVTNDAWCYAWYDNNWKTPKEILRRLISCVGRGGTYLLNVGPDGKGIIPERAAKSLRSAGKWIEKYPQVIYGADPSPWGHALPWGDVTCKDNKLYLCIFDWPVSGKLNLPGLKTTVKSINLCSEGKRSKLKFSINEKWLEMEVPDKAPEVLVSVIEVELDNKPLVENTWGLDPDQGLEILAQFANTKNAKKDKKSWMEKYGEWKKVIHVSEWEKGGKAFWDIDVKKPGDYMVFLTYSGNGRLVWGVDVEGGEHIQNQQNSSGIYHEYPIGWLNFPSSGIHRVSVSCIEGQKNDAQLKSVRFKKIKF